MPRFDGQDVTILRVAGRNDAGYDPRVPKVFIGDDDGEHLIARADIDETDDMSDEDREAMDKAMGKTEEQSRVDDIRRDARARGMPPDQTPAPTIKLPSGREIPNPELIGDGIPGQAMTLEQEKGNPTIMRGGVAIQDRGDPGSSRLPLGDNEGRQRQSQAAQDAQQKNDDEKAQREREAAQRNAQANQPHQTPVPPPPTNDRSA